MAIDDRVRPDWSPPPIPREASARPTRAADPPAYDPAGLADRIERGVDFVESATLISNRNAFTSLFNAAVSTAAEVARGTTGVLRIGCGAAAGVEQIQNAKDGWDTAIGVSRILVDAGDVASNAVALAGAGAQAAESIGRVLAGDAATLAATTKRTKRLADGRMITEPELPSRVVAQRGEIAIEHNYRGNDHGPAHVHVSGGGPETRVGKNGRPLRGDPPLSREQAAVVGENKREIRRAVDKIGHWLWFQAQ
jgi:hypothetical protein